MTTGHLFSELDMTPTASATKRRDDVLQRIEQAAEAYRRHFSEQASVFVLNYLTIHGPSSGECVTDACKAAGITPHDDRAFGPVYMRLAKLGLITKQGTCPRKKGNHTSGGNVWAVML